MYLRTGTKVYVTNNTVWGMVPMTVVTHSEGSSVVIVKHPQRGVGGFELQYVKYWSKRPKSMRKKRRWSKS